MITKEVDEESFFNFFKSINIAEKKEDEDVIINYFIAKFKKKLKFIGFYRMKKRIFSMKEWTLT